MITYLDRHLPPELSDMIYRIHHRNIMNQITEILTHKTVFYIYHTEGGERLGWLVCETQNYYHVLDWE
jgi:hypothetical protein